MNNITTQKGKERLIQVTFDLDYITSVKDQKKQ